MLTLAGGYFVSTLRGMREKHHRDGNGCNHFVNECDPGSLHHERSDARNVKVDAITTRKRSVARNVARWRKRRFVPTTGTTKEQVPVD